MNKGNIKKAVKFLEGLEEDNFCRFEQTKEFKRKYVGECHCVVGHLFVNPKSPFFVLSKLNIEGTSVSAFGCIEKYFAEDSSIFGYNLIKENNYAKAGNIKNGVITFLKEQL